MEQVSGSIVLDFGKVNSAIQAEVSHEVNRQVVDPLRQISEQLDAIHWAINAVPLSKRDAVTALANNIPSNLHPSPQHLCAQVVEDLAVSGYALVAVSGQALADARLQYRQRATAIQRADQRLAQATADGTADSWFDRDND